MRHFMTCGTTDVLDCTEDDVLFEECERFYNKNSNGECDSNDKDFRRFYDQQTLYTALPFCWVYLWNGASTLNKIFFLPNLPSKILVCFNGWGHCMVSEVQFIIHIVKKKQCQYKTKIPYPAFHVYHHPCLHFTLFKLLSCHAVVNTIIYSYKNRSIKIGSIITFLREANFKSL